MDPNLLQLMQREVARQSRFALAAVDQIDAALAEWEAAGPDALALRDALDHLWSAVQSFLGATALVSKLLWGVKGRRLESRQPLRASLGVTEQSPVKNRDVRDVLEHFDERLETFVASGSPSQYLRNFDPDIRAITFEGKVYELEPIVAELRRLAQAGERESGFSW
jgi:hypothetical protein